MKQINPFPNDSQNPSCLEYKGEICFSICNYFFSVHFLFCLLSQFASSLSGYFFNVIKVSFIYKINQFMHKRSTSQTLQIIMCKNIFLMLICIFCYMHLELSFLIWPIVPQSFDIWVPVYYFFFYPVVLLYLTCICWEELKLLYHIITYLWAAPCEPWT